jgi:Asp/Glu/hydantoin racemase
VGAAKELVGMGADGITTNCGFLALHQAELAAAVQVPVAASSMMQVPAVQALLPPGQRVGIVTIDRSSLTKEHLLGAGAPENTPVIGTEGGAEFCRALLGDERELDVELARQDVVGAAEQLIADHPDVGAIVLECTNMPPYAADIAAAVSKPVFDFYTFVRWFQSGLRPRRFS